MPLTKQYLRYVSGDCFGVICSRKTRTLLLEKGRKGNKRLLAVSPALENVIVWDIKTGEKVHTWSLCSMYNNYNYYACILSHSDISYHSQFHNGYLSIFASDHGSLKMVVLMIICNYESVSFKT